MKDSGKRYIGLDVHKHYLIALGVDEEDTDESGCIGSRNDNQYLAAL